jgi:Putative outer membrane beta-barrel porin, MtrB/PioB
VRQMGWKGDIKARLRYTWERNSDANWQNDSLAPFTDIPGLTNGTWLGYYNPNYNVQIMTGSLVITW